MIERIKEIVDYSIFIDGFDNAVIGFDESSQRIIYSVKKCIEILMIDMCEEEALEYFEYNVQGSYMGDLTPIYCFDYFDSIEL